MQVVIMLKRLPPSWVRHLCLLPFMMSVLLPAGMMPAISGDGMITLTICTAHGPEERSFPAPDEEQEGTSPWCPFSLLSASILPAVSLQSAEITVGDSIDAVFGAFDVFTHRDVLISRPRGPPTVL